MSVDKSSEKEIEELKMKIKDPERERVGLCNSCWSPALIIDDVCQKCGENNNHKGKRAKMFYGRRPH